MDKPFAITLDVGSSLANKTGSWRTERPVYVDRLPPCNDACPAGENIQAVALPRRGAATTRPPGGSSCEDNPLPAVMGRVCYHPCETACNRAQLDEAVGINSVERFLGDEAIQQGWQLARARRRHRQARARRRRRAVRAVGRLPPDAPRPRGRRSATPARRRRHDALRHPAVPAAARRARRRDRSASSTWASSWSSNSQGRRPRRRRCTTAASTPCSSPSAPTSASAPTSPPARRREILDAVSVLRSMEGEEQPLLGRRVVVYGGGNTAMDVARTAKRLGADRGRHRLPAHARPDAGARLRGRGGARGGRADEAGSRRSSAPTRAGSCVERMELDETGFPQPTGELEELEADSLVLALGQEADLSLLDGVAGHRGRRTASCRSART